MHHKLYIKDEIRAKYKHISQTAAD